MNFMIIFDLIVFLLGIYIMYSVSKMKKSGEISTLFVPQEEIVHCHDVKGFVNYLTTKASIFGMICMIFAVVSFIGDVWGNIPKAVSAVLIIAFVGAWGWFSYELRKGKEQYF